MKRTLSEIRPIGSQHSTQAVYPIVSGMIMEVPQSPQKMIEMKFTSSYIKHGNKN